MVKYFGSNCWQAYFHIIDIEGHIVGVHYYQWVRIVGYKFCIDLNSMYLKDFQFKGGGYVLGAWKMSLELYMFNLCDDAHCVPHYKVVESKSHYTISPHYFAIKAEWNEIVTVIITLNIIFVYHPL